MYFEEFYICAGVIKCIYEQVYLNIGFALMFNHSNNSIVIRIYSYIVIKSYNNFYMNIIKILWSMVNLYNV